MTTVDEYQIQLERIESALVGLLDDIQSVSSGVSLTYAVDFTEIQPYLSPRDDDHTAVSSGVDIEPSEAAKRHLLTLHHLFFSFDINHSTIQSPKLQLFPPYLSELSSFARWASSNVDGRHFTQSQARNILESLTPSQREFLESLKDKSESPELSPDEVTQLTEIVKGDLGTLFEDVTRASLLDHQANLLRNLIEADVVQLDFGVFLNEKNLPPLKSLGYADGAQVDSILRYFDRELLKKKYLNKRRDAEALNLLMITNQHLGKNRSKLLLVTRDSSMYQVASEIHFKDGALMAFLRRPETVFFDLILHGYDQEQKVSWLEESLVQVRVLDGQIRKLVQRWSHRTRDLPDRSYFQVYRSHLMELVVKEAFVTWNKRINVALSQAVESLSWVPGLLDKEGQGSAKRRNSNYSEIESVRLILKFVESDNYSEIAITESRKILLDFVLSAERAHFINEFRDAVVSGGAKFPELEVDRIDGHDQGFLLSPVSARLPFIEFKSEVYKVLFEEFKASVNSHANYSDALNPLVEEAVSGDGPPEDLLFMAFILCVVERWDAAHRILKFANENYKNEDIDLAQIEFLIAFIERRIARRGKDVFEKIGWLEKSYVSIRRSLAKDSNDPRYLKESGGIVLEFFDLSMLLNSLNEREAITQLNNSIAEYRIDLDGARASLTKAWDLQKNRNAFSDDFRLRVEILNNLVFLEVVADKPDFKVAQEWTERMEVEFERLTLRHRQAAEALSPNLIDTNVMLRARRCYSDKDEHGIEACLDRLKELQPATYLEAHRTLLVKWREACVTSKVN